MKVRAGPTRRDQLVEDREGDPGADDAERERRPPAARARAPRRAGRSTAAGASSTVLATITQAATPSGGTVAEPVLGDAARRPRSRARRARTARPPSSCVAGAAEVDAEQDRDAGDAEHDARPGAAPCERSSWSTQIASSAVNSGAEATRIPASEEEISCSPAAISRNGPATWIAASSASRADQRPRSRPSAPRAAASGTSTSAASATRSQATIAGREVAEADLDEQVAGAPDRAEDEQQRPGAAVHRSRLDRAGRVAIRDSDRHDRTR